jgi:protein TonB
MLWRDRRSRSRTGFTGQTASAIRPDGIVPGPPTSATARPAIETPAPVETPVDARDRIVAATFRHEVRPVYPDIAKYGDQEGTVVVLATIGPEGRVLSARIAQSSGSLAIDAEALRAAQASSYYPPEIDGKPAIMTYRIVYTFQLT